MQRVAAARAEASTRPRGRQVEQHNVVRCSLSGPRHNILDYEQAAVWSACQLDREARERCMRREEGYALWSLAHALRECAPVQYPEQTIFRTNGAGWHTKPVAGVPLSVQVNHQHTEVQATEGRREIDRERAFTGPTFLDGQRVDLHSGSLIIRSIPQLPAHAKTGFMASQR
jgi:hypothetical protein